MAPVVADAGRLPDIDIESQAGIKSKVLEAKQKGVDTHTRLYPKRHPIGSVETTQGRTQVQVQLVFNHDPVQYRPPTNNSRLSWSRCASIARAA